jgi:probable phosphoglycerate mutase
MTTLYLIRHGESVSNVEPDGAIAGMQGDQGLTAYGRLQAESLRERLAATGEIRPDAVLSSTLPRARQTAEIVAPVFGLPVAFDDELQEHRPGEADGMRLAAAIARYGEYHSRTEPFRSFSPGGESWAEFTLRVGRTLDRITRAFVDKSVLLFTHGGVIDTSFLIFFGMSTMRVPETHFFTHNASITQWEHRGHDGIERWRLARYNDDLHVRAIGAREPIVWPRDLPIRDERGETPAMPLSTGEHEQHGASQ